MYKRQDLHLAVVDRDPAVRADDLVADGDRRQHGELARREVREQLVADRAGDRAAGGGDRRAPFAFAAIEDQYLVAITETQDVEDIIRLIAFQADSRAFRAGRIDEQALGIDVRPGISGCVAGRGFCRWNQSRDHRRPERFRQEGKCVSLRGRRSSSGEASREATWLMVPHHNRR